MRFGPDTLDVAVLNSMPKKSTSSFVIYNTATPHTTLV